MDLNYKFPSRSLTLLRMGSLTSIFSKGKFCDYLPRATSTLDTRRLFWKGGPIVPLLYLETSVTTTPITHKTMSKHLSLASNIIHHQAFMSPFLPQPTLKLPQTSPCSLTMPWLSYLIKVSTFAVPPSEVPCFIQQNDSYLVFKARLKCFLLRKSSLISLSPLCFQTPLYFSLL